MRGLHNDHYYHAISPHNVCVAQPKTPAQDFVLPIDHVDALLSCRSNPALAQRDLLTA